VERDLAPAAGGYDLRSRLEAALSAALLAEGAELVREPRAGVATLAITVREWGLRACLHEPEQGARVSFRLISQLRNARDRSLRWRWAPEPEFGRCTPPESYVGNPERLNLDLARAVAQLASRIALEWMYP